MEKIEIEKQKLYEGLVELTKESPSNMYFTGLRVFNYVESSIRWSDECDWSLLPRKSSLKSNLEELSEEGKIHKIIVEDGGKFWENRYRANI